MKIQSARITCVTSNFGGAQTFAVATRACNDIWLEKKSFLNDIFSIIMFQFLIQLNNLSKLYVALKI